MLATGAVVGQLRSPSTWTVPGNGLASRSGRYRTQIVRHRVWDQGSHAISSSGPNRQALPKIDLFQ
jgi:hypothetical protein